MSRWLKVMAVLVSATLSWGAKAETAECYVSIDGTEVLTGPCGLERTTYTDGIVLNFTAGDIIIKVLKRDSTPNMAGIIYTTHREHLGQVTALDACWVNERVRICAWPLHEHPKQSESPTQ